MTQKQAKSKTEDINATIDSAIGNHDEYCAHYDEAGTIWIGDDNHSEIYEGESDEAITAEANNWLSSVTN